MEVPYFFSLDGNNAVLFYLGVRHSWDPKDPQFSFIKEKWGAFLKESKKPSVITESYTEETYKNETEAILKAGEVGFVLYLARSSNIPAYCFEPDRTSEMNHAAALFSKEETAFYYFARTVAQWYRLKQKPHLNEYLAKFLERDRKISGWQDFEFSLNNMAKTQEKLFGTTYDLNSPEFFQKIENPTREDNPLRELVRALGDYRNKVVVDRIKTVWDDGNDLFVVYGRGHAFEHRRELMTPRL
jgi:hypothetical protein